MIKNWRRALGLARAGSPRGDQKRAEFAEHILSIVGDSRYLWIPKAGDTTTNTGLGANARTTTYAATVASLTKKQGSGLGVTFDAAAPVATVPDADNLSFGDGQDDEPVSVFAWLSVDATAAQKTILSKYALTTGSTKEEWRFYFDSSERLVFQVWDKSASAALGRRGSSAETAATPLFVAATYDGSGSDDHIKLYSAAALIAMSGENSGSGYAAMENLASLVRLGAEGDASGDAALVFDGDMFCVGLVSGQLSVEQLGAMNAAGNAFLELEL